MIRSRERLWPMRFIASSIADERIAAVLHDVVKDTGITPPDLQEECFSSTELAAVEALTKRAGESRLEAAARAAANPNALRVKLADNAENMDITRIANPSDMDFARLAE